MINTVTNLKCSRTMMLAKYSALQESASMQQFHSTQHRGHMSSKPCHSSACCHCTVIKTGHWSCLYQVHINIVISHGRCMSSLRYPTPIRLCNPQQLQLQRLTITASPLLHSNKLFVPVRNLAMNDNQKLHIRRPSHCFVLNQTSIERCLHRISPVSIKSTSGQSVTLFRHCIWVHLVTQSSMRSPSLRYPPTKSSLLHPEPSGCRVQCKGQTCTPATARAALTEVLREQTQQTGKTKVVTNHKSQTSQTSGQSPEQVAASSYSCLQRQQQDTARNNCTLAGPTL